MVTQHKGRGGGIWIILGLQRGGGGVVGTIIFSKMC